MRVFTTIFLAQPPAAHVECVDQSSEFDQGYNGLAEFQQALRERIAMLEACSWYEDDGADEK
ncbi:MAG: hypothetical protein WA354_05430 [Terracidiphilus sp.]